MPVGTKSASSGVLVGILFGSAPALTALLSLVAPAGIQPWVMTLKSISAPVLIAELFAIIIAAREGLLGRDFWRRIPAWVYGCLVVWLAIAWASALAIAPRPDIAGMRTAIWILHLLFGVAVFRFGESGALKPEFFARAILAGFAAYAALLAIFVVQLADPYRFNWASGGPGMPYLRHIGYYCAAVVGLGMGALVVTRTRRAWGLTTLCMGGAVAMACWSGTRGTFFAVISAYVIALLALPLMREWKVAWGLVASLAGGIAFSLLLPAYNNVMGIFRVASALSPSSEDIGSRRFEVWERTLGLVSGRPFFGHGEGQLKFLISQDLALPQPHNLELQLLFAWGLAGAVAIALPAILLVSRMSMPLREQGTLQSSAMGALTLLTYAQIDGTLFHVHPLAIFAGCVGLAATSFVGDRHSR